MTHKRHCDADALQASITFNLVDLGQCSPWNRSETSNHGGWGNCEYISWMQIMSDELKTLLYDLYAAFAKAISIQL